MPWVQNNETGLETMLLYRKIIDDNLQFLLIGFVAPSTKMILFHRGLSEIFVFACIFTPQPLRAPGYCRTPSGRAAGQTSPVNTLTSILFHGSFSNLARTFITLRFSDKFDHGGSASLKIRIMDHLMSRPLLTFLNSFFKLKSPNLAYR